MSLIKHDLDTEARRGVTAFLHSKGSEALRDCTGYYGMEKAEHAHKSSDGKETRLGSEMLVARMGDKDWLKLVNMGCTG